MSKLAKKLRKRGRADKRRDTTPVWKGPEEDGITQSLLSRFLVCRERFRLLVIEGLKPIDTFNHRLEYGQMWHICEEVLAANYTPKAHWSVNLLEYAQSLCRKYPFQQEQVQHWHTVCKVQFPIYVDYWAKQSGAKKHTPLLQEETFAVPYTLPSGRIVLLRGKWDAVGLEGKGKSAAIYLGENKTKGEIIEEQVKKQLDFDLQTMFYLTALSERLKMDCEMDRRLTLQNSLLGKDYGIPAGIRYNVVRRPLSGGKGSIRQHKPTKSKPQGESKEEFYSRLSSIIAEDPGHYFMRWRVQVTPQDIERFKQQFLNPLLEQLIDWWGWVSSPLGLKQPFTDASHWRTPYGFYNILAEGGSTELDEYLATGSKTGLQQTSNLFGELD